MLSMVRMFAPAIRAGMKGFATKAELAAQLSKDDIHWQRTGDAIRPYKTSLGKHELVIEVGDFPDEPLYTVLHKEEPVFECEGFLNNWLKQDALNIEPEPTQLLR